MSELAHQIRNYSCFTWLNGSFLLDWLIHNLDVCCWVKDAWPVSAQGQGGRQVRTRGRPVVRPLRRRVLASPTARGCSPRAGTWPTRWGFFGDVIHGAKGSAVLGEGITDPRIYKGHQQIAGEPDLEVQGAGLQPLPGRARPAVRRRSARTSPTTRRERCAYGRDDRHPGPHGRRIGPG